jgi:hypothetical protein
VAERASALGVGDVETVAKLIDWDDSGQNLDSAINGVLASHPRLRAGFGSADGGRGGSELVAEADPNMQLREAALGSRIRS